jgi:cell division initiation protein
MSVITPKDLAGKSFSSAFKGYNKTEVDEYVGKVTKNYSALYRRCAELEESLAVTTRRLESILNEESRAKKTLENAKEKSDHMIAEAYERADDILVSIKKNCDAILRDFHNKVERQKRALTEMNSHVELFKRDIFAKYRMHIELLEQLTPKMDFEIDYDPSEYVMRVVDDIRAPKQEITAEYDIVVGDDDGGAGLGFEGYYAEADDFNDMPTEEEIHAFIENHDFDATPSEEEINAFIKNLARKAMEEPPKNLLPIADVQDAENGGKEEAGGEADTGKKAEIYTADDTKVIIIPSNKRSSRKRRKPKNDVMAMLREYGEGETQNIPKIEAQLMLNLDDATESLIESPKK